MHEENHARERISGAAGFSPELCHYPDCQCKDCVHKEPDLLREDGTVVITGYDGSVCAKYDGNPHCKPDGILEGKVDCPYRKTN